MSGHGKPATYSHGCRCAVCRAAWSKYITALRIARKPEDAPRHGVTTSYNNYNCRCDACYAAKSADNARNKARRRARRVQAPSS